MTSSDKSLVIFIISVLSAVTIMVVTWATSDYNKDIEMAKLGYDQVVDKDTKKTIWQKRLDKA